MILAEWGNPLEAQSLLGRLTEKLQGFTIEKVLRFEEIYDEQFHALKYLYEKLGNKVIFLGLVVLNALVSYRLNCVAERYWWEFARYFSMVKNISLENLPDYFIEFLNKSTCGSRLREQKILRVKRSQDVIRRRINQINWLLKNQRTFMLELSEALNTKPSSKTIVFAIKMLNYALRIITGQKIVAPMSIDIPLDSRIIKISRVLKIKNPLEFWRRLSRKLGIPPLHLDSLLWIGLRIAPDIENLRKFLSDEKLVEFLLIMREIHDLIQHV